MNNIETMICVTWKCIRNVSKEMKRWSLFLYQTSHVTEIRDYKNGKVEDWMKSTSIIKKGIKNMRQCKEWKIRGDKMNFENQEKNKEYKKDVSKSN